MDCAPTDISILHKICKKKIKLDRQFRLNFYKTLKIVNLLAIKLLTLANPLTAASHTGKSNTMCHLLGSILLSVLHLDTGTGLPADHRYVLRRTRTWPACRSEGYHRRPSFHPCWWHSTPASGMAAPRCCRNPRVQGRRTPAGQAAQQHPALCGWLRWGVRFFGGHRPLEFRMVGKRWVVPSTYYR